MNPKRLAGLPMAAAAVALALSAVYTAGFGIFDEAVLRAGTIGLGLLVLLFQALFAGRAEDADGAEGADAPPPRGLLPRLADAALVAGTVVALGNFFVLYDALQTGLFELSRFDLVTGWIGLAVILEMTRRLFGIPLFLVAAGSVAYCLWGKYLPWIFGHAGFSEEQVQTVLWFSFDGVFGRAIAVVTNFILVFIVFGAVLDGVGAGRSVLKIVFRATGRLRGGPAYAAVVSSAMFGTLSGSVAANVVGTGVFTIPMIRDRGFSARFAGAIEAAASTGGQIMPPVMGAVAFIMADVTGIPYLTICVAALVPALFYYGSLFCAVGAQAAKLGIKPVAAKDQEPVTSFDWAMAGALGLSLAVIIYFLVTGSSPALAGFWATVVAFAAGLVLNSSLWRDPARLAAILVSAGRSCAVIVVAVAAIGIVIGAMNMTGLGLRFASAILALSENSVVLSLFLMMAGCLVLGMGMPTVPAYLIIVLVMGPAIEKMGFSTLTVHLFVVYYGVLSSITPPVAIAAYAAAPISGSKPMETALEALRIALAGFVIPFFLIYNPSITLVEDFTLPVFAWACLRLGLAVWLMATGLVGHDAAVLPPWQRALRTALGFALVVPLPLVEVAATVLGGLVVGLGRWRRRAVLTNELS
ncbi:MAG: TRAP transporter fused permease subunit [Hyphomicrobiales bacterium]|nr:TRAP transporter fused permease subunit [Hyphomicrobiales bacterium]MCP5370716.1 TRAP transporter fused permease subunit [Hyphomicrobiales bacterium]